MKFFWKAQFLEMAESDMKSGCVRAKLVVFGQKRL